MLVYVLHQHAEGTGAALSSPFWCSIASDRTVKQQLKPLLVVSFHLCVSQCVGKAALSLHLLPMPQLRLWGQEGSAVRNGSGGPGSARGLLRFPTADASLRAEPTAHSTSPNPFLFGSCLCLAAGRSLNPTTLPDAKRQIGIPQLATCNEALYFVNVGGGISRGYKDN